MNAITSPCADALHADIEKACVQACKAIAPAWPLDQAIAVNPHWSRVGLPLRHVAARMAVLADIQVFPSRSSQLAAWEKGRIRPQDLEHALKQLPQAQRSGLSPQVCIDALRTATPIKRLPLLIDVLDNDEERHSRLAWRQAITHQVSQTCAAYFDQDQADWQPTRTGGLYAFWRDTLTHDHGIGLLMGLPHLGRAIDALPQTAQDAERWVIQCLGLPQHAWADYLEAVLLTINGWASWCAYLGWQAQLAGGTDTHLRELLAIRLAWGVLLLECKDDNAASHAFETVQRAWADSSQAIEEAEEVLLVDELWQLALEAGHQREVIQQLRPATRQPTPPTQFEVQAAFCIDVRSERLRRALESIHPGIQTLGFAGFFGLPVAYTPLATQARRAQLPGLLSPSMEVTEQIVSPAGSSSERTPIEAQVHSDRRTNLRLKDQWANATRWPGASFSFVEAAGFAYLGKLGNWLQPHNKDRVNDDHEGLPVRYRAVCRPQLTGLDTSTKTDLAAKVLHAMGLKNEPAPLVLLIGHGSQSANNAHAAALDCGACCGQTGEVNARSLAMLLNEAPVRVELQARGIHIPDTTWFVAALHNTTTDEIDGFDIDLLPPDALERWKQWRNVFEKAGDLVRRERAPSLRIKPDLSHEALLLQLRRRANDGAQTRPEWGLAGNSTFLIAPRHRSQGVNLDGRSFLHDYDESKDSDLSILELLMTAPMLVTHWINWQYHASTCDPVHFGSGNKLLHNVVGGKLGVFEGNGGDLRIGLAKQSLHNGNEWIHEPLRLTVIIDASRKGIESVINKHALVRQLLDNSWLHLWRFEQQALERYWQGEWHTLQFE